MSISYTCEVTETNYILASSDFWKAPYVEGVLVFPQQIYIFNNPVIIN